MSALPAPSFPTLAECACNCPECRRLDARYPGQGCQLRLTQVSSEEHSLPLPDPDAPASVHAGLSSTAPAAQSRLAARGLPEAGAA